MVPIAHLFAVERLLFCELPNPSTQNIEIVDFAERILHLFQLRFPILVKLRLKTFDRVAKLFYGDAQTVGGGLALVALPAAFTPESICGTLKSYFGKNCGRVWNEVGMF